MLTIGVAKETYPGERRVALTPHVVPALEGAAGELVLEEGAGRAAGFPDEAYREKGVRIVRSREEVFGSADVIVQVRAAGANPKHGREDLPWMREGQLIIGLAEPLSDPESAREVALRGVTLFAMDLMPRTSRAQSMDALSSMATVAGYKAVVMAAERLPRMFPMLVTAAGTVAPARVFVLGAGVAGLQAIATARRLGGGVQAYDVRPETRTEILSLGARFVEVSLAADQPVRDEGGYARAQSEEFYERQREAIAQVVAASDVVVATAAVPGKRAPVLVSAAMARSMAPGSVIVDVAAERGGNCELTRPGETVEERGVSILGPTNLPSTVPFHASQMYAKNVTSFLLHLVREGRIDLDRDDDIIRHTLVTRDGELVHRLVREAVTGGA